MTRTTGKVVSVRAKLGMIVNAAGKTIQFNREALPRGVELNGELIGREFEFQEKCRPDGKMQAVKITFQESESR